MERPSSDYFLELLRRSRLGRLKIYIGMIAGVGKTYRMLQEAHELRRAGVDVRIGFIETHGRAETAALMEELPVIPRKVVYYRGRQLEEMDLDAILTEHPQVVLVDELAHTNTPGCRNEKRWQDVLELLHAGISVISAFNVQHLETLADRVEYITGVKIRELIPDRILQQADEVVNIDLPAEDLVKRLREGKIYHGEQIQRALENFFQPDKILQLRDLALRQVATLVEQRIERGLSPEARLPVERFLACISTNVEGGKKIIRKAARLAGHYQAEWFVLNVQTRREAADRIDLAAQRHLLANLRWAVELGATVLREESEDVPNAIVKAAQARRITNIIIGRPNLSLWRQFTGRNYLARLVRQVEETDIDVIIVS